MLSIYQSDVSPAWVFHRDICWESWKFGILMYLRGRVGIRVDEGDVNL